MNKKITLTLLFSFVLIVYLISIVHSQDVDIKLIMPNNETEYNNQSLNEQEDLIFYVCPNTEVTNIKSSLICKENFKFIELETVNWRDNCYLSKYDLKDIACQNLQIQFEYKENNQQIKLTKDIRITKNSNILGYVLNKQNVNGGFDQNPLYAAYGVWVMSNYGNIYSSEMDGALSWLKFNRDDKNKCWPKNSCDITTTSQILYLLNESGFDDNLRIIKDAKIWIEKNQNYLVNSLWTLKIDANSVYVTDDATCNLTLNGQRSFSNLVIPINTIYERNITVNNNNDIKLDCTQEVQTTIQDQFGQVVYSKDQKNLFYHIGEACYGQQQFQVCKEYSNDNFVKFAVDVDTGEDYLGRDLNLTITNDTKISCSVRFGGQMATFSIPQNQSYTYNVLINQEDDIQISCDYFTKMTIYNEDYLALTSNVTKNLTYDIRNNCDMTNKYTVCDVKATGSAIASGIDENLADLAYSWMVNNIKEDVVGSYVVTKDILSNEFFIIATKTKDVEKAQSVIDWLTFNQNNDGSWGHSTKIKENLIETIYGALALTKFNSTSSSEAIDDAKQWVQDYEPEDGWGDVEKNSLAFWAIKNRIKPFLKTNPQIIIIDKDEVQVNIVNPTDFNIKDISFEFTDGLNEYVSIEPIAEIFKKSYKRIVLKLKNNKEETHYGFMIIRNKNYQLAKIPIITQKLPEINIGLPTEAIIYGDRTKVKATVNYKTNGTFMCTLKWDNTLIDKTFSVNTERTIDVIIETKEVKRQSRNVTGEIICQKDQNTMRNSVSLYIDQYVTKPFDVKPKSLIIIETKKDVSFAIENLIDKSVTADIEFNQDAGLLEFDKRRITINPGESENITVINLVPDNLNFTQDVNIIVSSLGQEEIIPLRVAIIEMPKAKANFTNLYIILILLFIFTATWGVLKVNQLTHDKKYNDKIRNFVNKLRKNEVYKMMIAPFAESWLEKKFPLQIIENKSPQQGEKINIDADMIVAVKFLKTLGKDEKTIRDKLKAQGFSDAYITECIKQVS